MRENSGVRLSAFKGTKAKLNRAIFQALSQCGPLTIYDVCKSVRAFREFRHTRYSVINRRVHALEKEGFLEVSEVKEAEKVHQEMSVYRLTPRAHLATLLDRIDLDLFLRTSEESKIAEVLRVLSHEKD